VDLKKDPRIIEPAYDDSAGVSREFALNILHRLNRELGADFDVEQFEYEAPFNEAESRVEMAIVSLRKQKARIDGREVEFEADERIRTEFSYKYDLKSFAELAGKAGLKPVDVWTDPKEMFSVQRLRPA